MGTVDNLCIARLCERLASHVQANLVYVLTVTDCPNIFPFTALPGAPSHRTCLTPNQPCPICTNFYQGTSCSRRFSSWLPKLSAFHTPGCFERTCVQSPLEGVWFWELCRWVGVYTFQISTWQLSRMHFSRLLCLCRVTDLPWLQNSDSHPEFFAICD